MSLLTAILKPHDGTRTKVRKEVAESATRVETARSKFEDTVRELLEVNDRITGKNADAAKSKPNF